MRNNREPMLPKVVQRIKRDEKLTSSCTVAPSMRIHIRRIGQVGDIIFKLLIEKQEKLFKT